MENEGFKVLKVDEFLELTNRKDFWDIIKQEYEKIVAVLPQGTAIAFSRSGNLPKNRFPYIPCWDHSRVVISSHGNITHDYGDWKASRIIITPRDSSSTYIHANFVDGFEEEKKFIAAQGPMQRTAGDWWKMIFEQNSQIIVMLTDTHDGFREICYGYWVYDEAYEVAFGRYVIRTLQIEEQLNFIKTRLQLIDITTGTAREIFHFWYTGWSDMNNTNQITEFLALISEVNLKQAELKKKAVDENTLQPGPIIVHCSTGIERTGTFCAIDNALAQFNNEKTVSLPQTVLKIRSQRHSSVCSFEQYAFCYQVLKYVFMMEGDYKWECLANHYD